jgi:hypothetical protein
MENKTKNRRASRSEREETVAAFRASGLTQEAFAGSRGLKTATFRNWLYASGGSAAEPGRDGGFIEVALSRSASPVATLRFVDGTTIDLPLSELERVALRLARELERR